MTPTASPNEPPVLCSLSGGDYQARLAWIATLNAEALRAYHRDDLRLELTYAPEARDRVREMVGRERECCAFLDFDLRDDRDAVRLMISAPERARGAADDVFAPFVPGMPAAASCGCSASKKMSRTPRPLEDAQFVVSQSVL